MAADSSTAATTEAMSRGACSSSAAMVRFRLVCARYSSYSARRCLEVSTSCASVARANTASIFCLYDPSCFRKNLSG